jgi:hypothetical protein
MSRYIGFTEEILKEYRSFVHRCACYNTRTATNILVYHKCRLFSARKICALTTEFMNERDEKEALLPEVNPPDDYSGNNSDNSGSNNRANKQSVPLLANNKIRALILLSFVSQLPSYARVCGGMLICALSEYLTSDEWREQLDFTEDQQNEKLLWTEAFINACIVLREEFSGASTPERTAAKYNFIETEAEKMPLQLSCMSRDEYVELTFVD